MDLLNCWSEEKNSAYLYQIIAAQEKSATRKELFLELATMANKQAELWEQEIKKSGQSIPLQFKPKLRTRIVGRLIQRFGTNQLRLILSAMKIRGMAVFLNIDPNYPFSPHPAHHENRHKAINNAGNLRAAVFGINDGLVSNISLILGVAGATLDPHFILLSGVAGMLAGAFSMGAGEYISVRSQREFYEYQIALERNELEQYPQEEAAELAAIYHARGLAKEESINLANSIISNPEKALDTLAREELALNPKELGSPWGAAISSFVAFSFGAIIPLIPYFFGFFRWNLVISIILTLLTLFLIGLLISLFTNRNAFISGLRMLLIGASAGTITYLIGTLIGVSVH